MYFDPPVLLKCKQTDDVLVGTLSPSKMGPPMPIISIYVQLIPELVPMYHAIKRYNLPLLIESKTIKIQDFDLYISDCNSVCY